MLPVGSLVKRYMAQNLGTVESAVVVESTYSSVRLYIRTGAARGKVYDEQSPGYCLLLS